MPRVSKTWSYEKSKRRYVANLNREKRVLLPDVDQTKENDALADRLYTDERAIAAVEVTGDRTPIQVALSKWLRWLKERPNPVAPNTFAVPACRLVVHRRVRRVNRKGSDAAAYRTLAGQAAGRKNASGQQAPGLLERKHGERSPAGYAVCVQIPFRPQTRIKRPVLATRRHRPSHRSGQELRRESGGH